MYVHDPTSPCVSPMRPHRKRRYTQQLPRLDQRIRYGVPHKTCSFSGHEQRDAIILVGSSLWLLAIPGPMRLTPHDSKRRRRRWLALVSASHVIVRRQFPTFMAPFFEVNTKQRDPRKREYQVRGNPQFFLNYPLKTCLIDKVE